MKRKELRDCMISKDELMRFLGASAATLLLIGCGTPVGSSAQGPARQVTPSTEVSKPKDIDAYRQSLETVLPLDPLEQVPGRGRIFSLTLRYAPAFSPESRVRLSLDIGPAGTSEYVWLDRRLEDAVVELLNKGQKATADRLIKAAGLHTKSVDIGAATLTQWHELFLRFLGTSLSASAADAREFARTGDALLVPDAEVVEFWYEQGPTQLHGRLTEPAGSALIKWADSLRRQLAEGVPRSDKARDKRP
jgi:hypothetical protein